MKNEDLYYKGLYEVENKYGKIKNYVIIFMASIFVLIILISGALAFLSPEQKTEVKNENNQIVKPAN